MKHLAFTLWLLLCSAIYAAQPQTLFFARDTATDSTRIALYIEGNQVTGSKQWQPKREGHGAKGILQGTIKDGIISAVYEYSIEGSDQSQQELYKLDGDTLLAGVGEMVDRRNNGKLTFKDRQNVEFKLVLKRLDVREPKPGTAERKAIMDAMRGPVSQYIGKPVIFTGEVRAFGSWARFQGNAATADGSKPKKSAVAEELELDFFALLRVDGDGAWQVMHSGFSGDISVREDAREKFPKAPWMLFE